MGEDQVINSEKADLDAGVVIDINWAKDSTSPQKRPGGSSAWLNALRKSGWRPSMMVLRSCIRPFNPASPWSRPMA